MRFMSSALRLSPDHRPLSLWQCKGLSCLLAGVAMTLAIALAFTTTMPRPAHAQQLEPFVPPAGSLQKQGLSEAPSTTGRAGPIDPNAVLNPEVLSDINFQQEMRNFVMGISRWSKRYVGHFSIIAMNGLDLTEQLEASLFASRGIAKPASGYIHALDGVMIEAPFYGMSKYGEATDPVETEYIDGYIKRLSQTSSLRFYIQDYTDKQAQMNAARQKIKGLPGLYYAAPPPGKQLAALPKVPSSPIGTNAAVVNAIDKAKNYAMIVDSKAYGSKAEYINALANTNFDVVILDAFYRGTEPLTYADMKKLRYKRVGTPRLLLAYLDIGTAQSWRYYWKNEWQTGKPPFIDKPKSDARWGQEYHVRYWHDDWQKIIFGSEDSYLGGLMKLGFDGVVLDGLEDYKWWLEQRN